MDIWWGGTRSAALLGQGEELSGSTIAGDEEYAGLMSVCSDVDTLVASCMFYRSRSLKEGGQLVASTRGDAGKQGTRVLKGGDVFGDIEHLCQPQNSRMVPIES